MAPRFVELSTPVSDGVQWAHRLPSAMAAAMARFVPENVTARMSEYVPEVEGLDVVADAVMAVPPPRGAAMYALFAAATAGLLWVVYVHTQTRTILQRHGQVAQLKKEF